MKTSKMRGQAHVVFKDIQASTQAMRSLQGFDFFGKEMVRPRYFTWLLQRMYIDHVWLTCSSLQKIVYAKGSSNILAKLRGTYNPPSLGAAPAGASTDLQKSIFSGPPGAIPSRPAAETNGEAHGVKRPRQDESDEEEAPMEEDSDVPMEASSDED